MKTTLLNFSQIYRKYYKDVYRFSLYLCADKDSAKDISSETFIRMWTAKSELKFTTVKAYLLAIARNIYLQEQRKKNRYTELDESILDKNALPDSIAETKSELDHVMSILQELNETDRSIIILRAFENLNYNEISKILNITVSSLKIKLFRTRQRLEERMKDKRG